MPSPIRTEREIQNDHLDPRSPREIGTRYLCGEPGADEVEVYIPDDNGPNNPIEVLFLMNAYPLAEIERMLPNLTALLNDAKVRRAIDRKRAQGNDNE